MANTILAENTEGKEGKICATCKKFKPLHRYYKRENKKPEIHCRDCRNKQREKNHRHWKQQFIYKLAEHIDIKCVKCGYDKNFSALDFHHTKRKKFAIAREIRNLSKKNFTDGRVDMILTEIIAKCEILCANCHREHHNKHIMKMKK